jgi:hypothetical protein
VSRQCASPGGIHRRNEMVAPDVAPDGRCLLQHHLGL